MTCILFLFILHALLDRTSRCSRARIRKDSVWYYVSLRRPEFCAHISRLQSHEYCTIYKKPRQIFLTKFCRGLFVLCFYMGSDSLRNYFSGLNIRSTDFLLKNHAGSDICFTDIQRQRPTSQAAPSPPRSLPF